MKFNSRDLKGIREQVRKIGEEGKKEKIEDKTHEIQRRVIETQKEIKKEKINTWGIVITIGVVVGVFTIVAFILHYNNINESDSSNEKQGFIEQENNKSIELNANNVNEIDLNRNLVEKPLPENGYSRLFYSNEAGVSTFRAIADPYNNYYVCLVDHFDNHVLDIFVHAGQNVKVRVPLGVYKLKWVKGDKWYGDNDLFGNKNAFRKSLRTLNFTQKETKTGNIIKGNTVDFNKMIGETPYIRINENDF
jgi:hypothetical protein